MKKKFSMSWNSSKQPRKQRKYRLNAPLHIRHKLMAVHLSEELRKKYARRSFPIRTKDKVRILRGQFRGVIGDVEEVDSKHYRVYVKGAEIEKTEGRKVRYPVSPSSLIALTLNLDDKRRKSALERASKGEDKK